MIIYFVAVTPHIEKAPRDGIFMTYEGAKRARELLERYYPSNWSVWKAEVTNITRCKGDSLDG